MWFPHSLKQIGGWEALYPNGKILYHPQSCANYDLPFPCMLPPAISSRLLQREQRMKVEILVLHVSYLQDGQETG